MPTGLMKLADGTLGSAHPAAITLSADAGKLRVRSVITTAAPDRAGDVIVPTGLRNLDDYRMNPVALCTKGQFSKWGRTRRVRSPG